MEYKTKITFGEGKNKVILMTDASIDMMMMMIGIRTTENTRMLVDTILNWVLEKDITKKGSLDYIIPGSKIAYSECI